MPPEGTASRQKKKKKQQGRKGKGLWVILFPGMHTVDNELGIVCLFAVGVRARTCVCVSDIRFAGVDVSEVKLYETSACDCF